VIYENRVLKEMSGLMREKATGVWRKWENEELHNLHSSPTITGAIKSRMMRQKGHVARMKYMRIWYRTILP
jgi:hypothetical protein